jgi:hypothetical protein
MVEVRLGVYGVVWIFIHMVFLWNVCMFVVSMPVYHGIMPLYIYLMHYYYFNCEYLYLYLMIYYCFIVLSFIIFIDLLPMMTVTLYHM